MELNVDWFNRHLDQMGQDFLWRRSHMCPCISPHSGAPQQNCPRCLGKGRSWKTGVAARAGMASQSVQRSWAQFGRYEAGDAVLSVPETSPLYEAGEFDRVTMLNNYDRFDLVLSRGSRDRISFPVQRIERIYWLDQSSNEVDGDVPTIGEDGALTWAEGQASPPMGKQYSVSGIRFSEYFLFGDMPGDRGHHYGARLPRKVVLRRFDLYGR